MAQSPNTRRWSSTGILRKYETGGVLAVVESGYGFCSESVDVRILVTHVVVLHAQSVTYLVGYGDGMTPTDGTYIV